MKKLTPHIFFWIACALMVLATLNSCKTKKEVLHTLSVSKVDSVYISRKIIETPPILSSLIINEICDSVTGKAKEFKQVFVVDKDTSTVEIKNNELIINFNLLNKKIREKDSIVKIRDSQIKELKETKVTKTATNWKLILILISIPLVFIIFPKIPQTINSLVKKLFV